MKKHFIVHAIIVLTMIAKAAGLPMPPTIRPVELASGQVSVVALSPTLKVLPTESFTQESLNREYRRIYLAGAPGESEQIQLAVKPDQELSHVSLSFDTLKGAEGEIPPKQWNCRRIHHVHIPMAGRWYGIIASQTGMIPDPVVEEETMSFAANEYGSMLLTLKIPNTIPSGSYSGFVTLDSDRFKQRIPIELQVWDFRFPAEHKLDTVACGVSFEDNPELMKLMKGVVTHVKYGVNSGLKVDYDKTSDKLTVDASGYLDAIEKYGKEYHVKFALPPTLLGGGSKLNDYMHSDKKAGEPGFEAIHGQFLAQMREQLKARHMEHDMFYYIMDEFPEKNFPAFNMAAAQSRKVFPELPVMVLPGEPASDELLQNSNIWCVNWHFFITREEHTARWKKLQKENGLIFWAYMNSLYHINATWNPKGMRFFPIALAGYGYRGALWWHLSFHVDDPESNVWTEPVPTLSRPNSPERLYGSGYLFYPPRTEKERWSSSLRWENYVQGTEDYSLMMLLKERWENTRKTLNVKSEDFDGYAALEMFWAMLGSSFRVQNYFAEPLYIDRFRQLLAHEISAHHEKPLALVDIQPTDARAVEALHVRCLAEKGCTFKINGEVPNWIASDGSACSTEIMLQPGYNLITVQLTDQDGRVKTHYREVLKK